MNNKFERQGWKNLEDEGQWSVVSRKMKKFNKNVGHNVSMEKVTSPI